MYCLVLSIYVASTKQVMYGQGSIAVLGEDGR